MKRSESERIDDRFDTARTVRATWKIIARRIRWRAACGGNMSGTHRCCLRLLSISHVHTDGSHPGKVTRWCATDLFIDRGFDLARGYRFRVVASWRVILSAIHNVSATTNLRSPSAHFRGWIRSRILPANPQSSSVTARCTLYYVTHNHHCIIAMLYVT